MYCDRTAGWADQGLRAIVPHDVVAVAVIGDEPSATLLSDEESALGQVADVRRREYTIARHCARRALGSIGIGPVPILSGPNREPLWPRDVVGSLTHCRGYCAAAVARRGRIISIGIDAEPHDPLPEDILPMVGSPEECKFLETLPQNGVAWDRLMFSAKESVYKAWFPLAANWLGFKDVAMTIDAAAATFVARLLVRGLCVEGQTLAEIVGRFLIHDHFIVTAAVIGRDGLR
jgi:enterobactin synthetase component D / holo-[acyl-carrier protein] synthase